MELKDQWCITKEIAKLVNRKDKRFKIKLTGLSTGHKRKHIARIKKNRIYKILSTNCIYVNKVKKKNKKKTTQFSSDHQS